MTDEERQKYLTKCRVIKRVGEPGSTQFKVEYYLKNYGRPEWKICKKAFKHFFDKSDCVLNRENRSIFERGMIIDKRIFNSPSINQYGPPISEADWERLEKWICDKVPRKKVITIGKTVWQVGEPGSDNPITHKELLDRYNTDAEEKKWRKFTMSNWKKCWYQRLRLNGKWIMLHQTKAKE